MTSGWDRAESSSPRPRRNVGRRVMEAAGSGAQRLFAADARADCAASAGAGLGSNAFLACVHQAVSDAAEQVCGALS